MTSAQGLRLDRPGVFHPEAMVNVVDIKIVETPAAGPDETMKALDLPEQFAGAARPLRRIRRAARSVHPVAAQQNEVADFAIVDALRQFLHPPIVARHQAHADLEVLGARFCRKLQHSARGWGIDRKSTRLNSS